MADKLPITIFLPTTERGPDGTPRDVDPVPSYETFALSRIDRGGSESIDDIQTISWTTSWEIRWASEWPRPTNDAYIIDQNGFHHDVVSIARKPKSNDILLFRTIQTVDEPVFIQQQGTSDLSDVEDFARKSTPDVQIPTSRAADIISAVSTKIENDVDKDFIDNLGVDAATLNGKSGAEYDAAVMEEADKRVSGDEFAPFSVASATQLESALSTHGGRTAKNGAIIRITTAFGVYAAGQFYYLAPHHVDEGEMILIAEAGSGGSGATDSTARAAAANAQKLASENKTRLDRIPTYPAKLRVYPPNVTQHSDLQRDFELVLDELNERVLRLEGGSTGTRFVNRFQWKTRNADGGEVLLHSEAWSFTNEARHNVNANISAAEFNQLGTEVSTTGIEVWGEFRALYGGGIDELRGQTQPFFITFGDDDEWPATKGDLKGISRDDPIPTKLARVDYTGTLAAFTGAAVPLTLTGEIAVSTPSSGIPLTRSSTGITTSRDITLLVEAQADATLTSNNNQDQRNLIWKVLVGTTTALDAGTVTAVPIGGTGYMRGHSTENRRIGTELRSVFTVDVPSGEEMRLVVDDADEAHDGQGDVAFSNVGVVVSEYGGIEGKKGDKGDPGTGGVSEAKAKEIADASANTAVENGVQVPARAAPGNEISGVRQYWEADFYAPDSEAEYQFTARENGSTYWKEPIEAGDRNLSVGASGDAGDSAKFSREDHVHELKLLSGGGLNFDAQQRLHVTGDAVAQFTPAQQIALLNLEPEPTGISFKSIDALTKAAERISVRISNPELLTGDVWVEGWIQGQPTGRTTADLSGLSPTGVRTKWTSTTSTFVMRISETAAGSVSGGVLNEPQLECNLRFFDAASGGNEVERRDVFIPLTNLVGFDDPPTKAQVDALKVDAGTLEGDTKAQIRAPRVVGLTHGAAITVNANTTDVGTVTLTGPAAFNITGGVNRQVVQIATLQDATGGRAVTLNNAIVLDGRTFEAGPTTAGAHNEYFFQKRGTVWVYKVTIANG